MQFNADVADGMPWKFIPTQREVAIDINVIYVPMRTNVCHFHVKHLKCFLLINHNSLLTDQQVRVKPGESALAFYTAENRSSTPITGVSTYNVTPMKVQILKLKFFSFISFRSCYASNNTLHIVFFYCSPRVTVRESPDFESFRYCQSPPYS